MSHSISLDSRLSTHPNPFLPARPAVPDDEPAARPGRLPEPRRDDDSEGLDAWLGLFEAGQNAGPAVADLKRVLAEVRAGLGGLAGWQIRTVADGWRDRRREDSAPPVVAGGDDTPF